LIWVKRGDYLIVSTTAPDQTEEEGHTSSSSSSAPAVPVPVDMKVQYLVKSILQKEQIAHIQKMNLW
jgi:hypothetical protein